MATLAFIYRPSTKSGEHVGALIMRIIHKRKIRKITTVYHIYPDEWDSKKKKLIIPSNNSSRKIYLLQVESMMKQDVTLLTQVLEMLNGQGEYTVEDVVKAYGMFEKRDMLTGFVYKLIRELQVSGQERTARAYNTAMKKFLTFNNNKDIRLEHINSHLLKSFENELIFQGKSPNTISFYMRNLRAIFNKAVNEKYIEPHENPFRSVYTGIRTTRKRALYQKDLTNLYSVDPLKKSRAFDYEKLFEAKQFFFFCFHSRGMSFVDMAYLRKENIRNGIVNYYRRKTGKLIEVKVTLEMQEIIN